MEKIPIKLNLPFKTDETPEDDEGPKQEKDQSVDYVFDQPEVVSYTTLSYNFSEYEGRELKAGRMILFNIPEAFKGRLVRDVILRHRKGEKYRKDIGSDRHDPHGAYSRIEVHDSKTGQWKSWYDPKGYSSDKFAESRPAGDPENEVLHDWIATVGPVETDMLRITNVGDVSSEYTTSQIHGIDIVFFPDLQGVNYQERVYTPGTSFIDLEKKQLLPRYGGGSHTEGVYKGAIPLNFSGRALYELGEDPGPEAELDQSRLVLELPAGKSLVQAEISLGDTEHLSEVSYKTKRHTRLGYAKLWVGIRRAKNHQVEWFIKNANVPPQGVIAGGPNPDSTFIEPGDQLVIESRSDTAYIMGWRLAYKDAQSKAQNKSDSLAQAA